MYKAQDITERISDYCSTANDITATTMPISCNEARGLGFESRWRQIISEKSAVRGSDGICNYLQDFSLHPMLITLMFIV